jgi:hypothetical protein
MDDDTLFSDEDVPEEWLAQVFEVATLRSRNEQAAQRSMPSGLIENYCGTVNLKIG